jgi:hypothetical protein
MNRYTAPLVEKIDTYSREDAIGARLILEILCELRRRGLTEVSRATLLETLGCEDQIQSGDEEIMIVLSDEYLENKTEIDATIDARVAPRH